MRSLREDLPCRTRSRSSSGIDPVMQRLGIVVAGFVVLLLAGCGSKPRPASAAESRAGDPARITVTGDLPSTGSLGIDDLAAMPAEDFEWQHDGVTKPMRGVPMEAVLRKYGWDVGPGGKDVQPRDRRPGWRRAIVVTAADGFRAVFSSAEVTAENGPSKVFVVWQEDGKPLEAPVGPIRLLVPTDKKGSRSVRAVAGIRVMDLGK
jgi:DMSO/TMAO reductase YedYZ molybdopterin-dependent catalytic subunit